MFPGFRHGIVVILLIFDSSTKHLNSTEHGQGSDVPMLSVHKFDQFSKWQVYSLGKKEEDRTFIRQEIIEYLHIDDKNC